MRDLKSRLTGLSIAGIGGASWKPQEPDREIARRVLVFLEDRRVLYAPFECELPRQCVASVLEIRRFLTQELGAIGDRAKLADNLRAMRAACRQFLDQTGSAAVGGEVGPNRGGTPEWIFNQSLGELRALVGTYVAVLADTFDLAVEDGLAQALPPAPRDEDSDWIFDRFSNYDLP